LFQAAYQKGKHHLSVLEIASESGQKRFVGGLLDSKSDAVMLHPIL
jgi:hypothetical protein